MTNKEKIKIIKELNNLKLKLYNSLPEYLGAWKGKGICPSFSYFPQDEIEYQEHQAQTLAQNFNIDELIKKI